MSVIALFLTLSVSQAAPAPQAAADPTPVRRVLDQNGDGEVSRSEFHAETNRTFRRLDRDGDGFLSGAELTGQHIAWTPATIERVPLYRVEPAPSRTRESFTVTVATAAD